jgi:hypothetical protein
MAAGRRDQRRYCQPVYKDDLFWETWIKDMWAGGHSVAILQALNTEKVAVYREDDDTWWVATDVGLLIVHHREADETHSVRSTTAVLHRWSDVRDVDVEVIYTDITGGHIEWTMTVQVPRLVVRDQGHLTPFAREVLNRADGK